MLSDRSLFRIVLKAFSSKLFVWRLKWTLTFSKVFSSFRFVWGSKYFSIFLSFGNCVFWVVKHSSAVIWSLKYWTNHQSPIDAIIYKLRYDLWWHIPLWSLYKTAMHTIYRGCLQFSNPFQLWWKFTIWYLKQSQRSSRFRIAISNNSFQHNQKLRPSNNASRCHL